MSKRDHPLYGIYYSMRARCYNPNNEDYPNYGARGILVCERWLEKGSGFNNFVEDMGPRPEGYSLDRTDNGSNYEPANCRWASKQEQADNRRWALKITVFGETKNAKAWGRDERTPVHASTIYSRIRRGGWDPVEAVTTPPLPSRGRSKRRP